MAFDFISKWLEWSEQAPSPQILRLWAAIGALSAILSRRVWFQANSRLAPLYPNLYIMLVAPPRVGKDVAINAAADACREAQQVALEKHGVRIFRSGGESISPKGLLDKLANPDSKQMIKLGNDTIEVHSLSFFIPELTTAMPDYNKLLIGFLNDLWNCKPSFDEQIRGGAELSIKNPHLMMLMGNQPDTLYNIFPEAVFHMGFTARIFFIYSDERQKKKIWLEEEEEDALDQTLYNKLIQHLVDISQWSGKLDTTRGFRSAVNDFVADGPNPVPGSRFDHWNGGRALNAQKLAMCVAASEKAQTVTLAHWERSLEYLYEAEKIMPHIFDKVTTERGFSEDLKNLPRLFNGSRVITHLQLLTELGRTRPPYEVKGIITQAIEAGRLKPVYDSAGAPVVPAKFTLHDV